MREIYSEEITDPSLNELKEFASWYNEKLGNYPIIVGGWAVYFYTKGLGSKDIDVVFLDARAKDATLAAYFHSHGYIEKKRDFFDREYVKNVQVGDREIEIIIDAVSSKRTIIFEGKDARIPWSWAVKHNTEYRVGNASIYLPEIELLMMYKLGAILGRNIYLRTGLDFDYYSSKLWKDVIDVALLSKLKIDKKEFGKFMTESGLKKYAEEIMEIIEANFNDESKLILKENGLETIRGILLEL